MLVALQVDANDKLFPLIFAIVEGENDDNWGWFMACIQAKLMQRPDLHVISNRHRYSCCIERRLMGYRLRHAHHRFYVHHILVTFTSNLNMFLRATYER